MLLGE